MNAVPQLHDLLHDTARRLPDKVALVCDGQRHGYAQLEARSNALAHALHSRGVGRGDRVLIFGENSEAVVVAFWAALKANAVACVINPLTKSEKLAWLLQDCRAAALVADGALARVFVPAARAAPSLRTVLVSGAVPAHLEPAGLPGFSSLEAALEGAPADRPPPRWNLDIDLACLVYTSGSTGEPKGVMLTHRNMLTAAASITSYLELREDDVILGVLPLAFDYGLYQLLLATGVGGRLVLERNFAFPAQVLSRVVEEGVTGFPGVPTLFSLLGGLASRGDYDFSKVRFVTNTAAALHPKHITAVQTLFPKARIFSMYGLTECKRCTYLPPGELARKPGSVGLAIPNTELWLVDEEGRRLGPNQVGQLVIRGATVMRGYWEKPEETAKKLKPGPLPGEWVLYTGDLCRLDDEGFLYFVGRMDDIIKTRGEKVAPKEVEHAIVDLPGVREAAVVGVPDEVLGQAVKAYVVREPGAPVDARLVLRECQRRLEPFMVPREVVFVRALPRTDTGKLKKSGLEELPREEP